MKKFAVISGFLGAGKTTAMMALTKYYTDRYGRAAMISNDLGEDVELADHRLAKLSGCDASQIAGECICFCHDVLTARLNAYYDAGCELVVSDIPGFGVGALEHVYHGLTRDYPGQYALAPFTVLVEPESIMRLRDGGGDTVHILDAQLREADLIVLNKCDLLAPEAAQRERAYLAARYPEAQVLTLSARRGDGLDALCRALRDGSASLRHPEIDYDGDGLQGEMARMSECYLQYHALVCCFDFDGTAYLADLAEAFRGALADAGREIPHLKLLAWTPDGDYGKVDLLGTDRPVELTRPFAARCTELAVILNASAICPDALLEETLMTAVKAVSERYQLELTFHRRDCFGMGE